MACHLGPLDDTLAVMVDSWPFSDPRNLAVFTVPRGVMAGRLPMLRFCHDEEDGGWQFLTGEPIDMKEALLVSLESVVRADPTLTDLADLQLGWEAARTRVGEPWTRRASEKQHPSG